MNYQNIIISKIFFDWLDTNRNDQLPGNKTLGNFSEILPKLEIYIENYNIGNIFYIFLVLVNLRYVF